MRAEPQSCSSSNTAQGVLLPWRRLRQLLEREGIDGMLVSSPENVTYVSEYWGLSHWARRGTQVYALAWDTPSRSVDLIAPAALADLVTDRVAAVTQPHIYDHFVLESSAQLDEVEDIRVANLACSGAAGPLEALIAVIHGRAGLGSRLAVEWSGFAPDLEERLRRALPEIKLTSADRLLPELRAIKSRQEIDLLRRAAQITERAVGQAIGHAHPGVTEKEIAASFLHALLDEGALPETTVVGAGRRSALPNVLPSGRPLQSGDILRFDVGCRYHHYLSDIARVVAIGHASTEQQKLYSILADGVERAAATVRPGVTGAEVFAAAVETVRAHGIDYRRTHCGHGIGIANYDLPRISAESSDVFEPGMVICLETPYYQIGEFGLQVEDAFVVTADGTERLTHAPAELPIVAV